MRKSYIINSFLFLFILFILTNVFSCSSVKSVKYFQDIPDSGMLKTVSGATYVEPKVQVDDILSIYVQVADPLATQAINIVNSSTPNGTPSALGNTASLGQLTAGQSQVPNGYLVSKEGTVEVAVLGKIKVVGYTTSELTTVIHDIASKYYNNPVVSVRFSNFRVSVVGEVARPGVYVMNNEKVGLLDALAMAGDLTIYGKRENVLLIRTNTDGSKTLHRINLKKSDIISDPFYYLQQNDFVYVQPSTSKAAATDAAQARNYTIIGSILSLITIYLTRK